MTRINLFWFTVSLAAISTATGIGCGPDEALLPGDECRMMPPPPAAPADDIGQSIQATTCPIQECGINSAEINDIPIGELHVVPGQNTGEINQWGAQLMDYLAPDGSEDYVVRFDMGHLMALRGAEMLEGEQLIGSTFRVLNTNNGDEIELYIHDYDRQDSWTSDGFPIERFVFSYYNCATDSYIPSCTDAGSTPDESAWSVLVGGERYSWTDKTAFASGDAARGWFNIACYGNALYKMKFTGYDPQPSLGSTRFTAPEDRQATLKILTADFCGTGTSFTETGTPLYWINAEGWSENAAPPDSISEALWDENGALCLDMPRLGADTMQDIIDECASIGKVLPACADYDGPYLWATYNPAGPQL